MVKPTNPSHKKPPPPIAPKPKGQRKQQQQPLEVYCRLRPLKASTDEAALKQISNSQLQVAPQFGNGQQQIYQFKHVFQANTEQSIVFKEVGLPLVQDLISGQNGLLFTYGVTGAGKTFTITGKADQPGILPRLLDVLFNTLKNNNLQAMKYVFKPDNQNGFEIKSSPDALLQIQRENNVISTPTNRQPHMTPRSVRDDIKTLERLQTKWANRSREEGLIATINHDNNYAVFVSFVEVYNNYIYDLLDDSIELNTPARTGMRSQQQPIMRASKTIREDANKRVYVLNVVEVEVKSADEAFDAFLKGVNRRKIGKTQMNAESSRSHSVFTIRLVQAPLDQNGTEVLDNNQYIHVSQLSIVDLAGCERTTRTQATGSRLKEASNINNSLMSLRNCFDILRENQKTGKNNKHVPYRESKLTHLFKNYFEGEGAVKMVLCLNPGADDFNETQQVLLFGEQSQEITTNASRGLRFKHPLFDDDLCSPLTFGPPFPKRFLEDPGDETVIPEWINVAEKRKDAMHKAQENMLRRMSAIRQTISLIENERNVYKQQCETFKRDLEIRNAHVHRLEAKLREVTEERDGYNNMKGDQEQRIAQLENLLEQKEAICGKLQTENNALRTDFIDYLSKENMRVKKACKDILLSKLKELEQAKCLQLEKMKLVTKILEEDNIFTNLNMMSPIKSSTSDDTSAQTRPKVLYDEPQITTTITTVDRNNPNGPPVANPKFTSNLMEGAGKWIEHQPPGTIETGTVLQPQIKNSKSVTNLKPSDFKSGKYTKYAVTHHEATDSGNIQTQVFKGKVIPSATGGAQVIFNDIETLQQDSPAVTTPVGIVSRKRQALEQMAAQSSPSTVSSNTPTSKMLKNILRAPALMHGSPTASATSIRGGHYQLILSSKAYKHKYTGVRTFLSDKERVRNFVRLLDPEERKALQEELNLQEGTAPGAATELPPLPIDTDQAHAHEPPTYGQLQALSIHASLPFIGFGFLDNLIMIIAGDYIDLTLGVTLGISTMAAAGLGNALSDVAGVGSAYYVERIADKVGVKAPKLSLVQLQMPRTRWATQIGRAIGVAIGCIIGMFPLLFIPHKEDHQSHEAAEESNASK